MRKNYKILDFLYKKIKIVKNGWDTLFLYCISRIKLPHFPRKLTAAFQIQLAKKTIFLFLFLILLFNLGQSLFFPFDEEKRLRYGLLKQPQNTEVHESLGKYYLKLNSAAAEREYLLAEEFSKLPFSPESFKRESPWQTWIKINSQKQKIEQEILFWETVRQAFPNYQYATMKLAALYFQLGNMDRAKEYGQLAIQNSPTNESVGHLMERLK